MNSQFAMKAYEEHRQLFQHYSTLVFRARPLLRTLIIVVFGYLAGVLPRESGNGGDDELSFLAAPAALSYVRRHSWLLSFLYALATLILLSIFWREASHLPWLVRVAMVSLLVGFFFVAVQVKSASGGGPQDGDS